MACMPLLSLLLLSTLPLARPFGWNPFSSDDDDDDQPVNGTQATNTTVAPQTSGFHCQIIDDLISSANAFWDGIFPYWNEEPPKPTEPPPPTTTTRPPPRY